MYLRFAALGDSSTYGIGDRVGVEWRGWARLLADAMATTHDVSFCNVAVPGATSLTVRYGQLDEALDHRPDLASLIVGINDTMRSTWQPARFRADLLSCAQELDRAGATLLTARFHDHGAVFGLPERLRRPLTARIEVVNAVYDELHSRFDTLRLDLAGWPEVSSRAFWSIDRLHPSERGHRALARGYADLLHARGLAFEPPALEPDGAHQPDWRSEVRWVVAEGAPWIGRRARDLGPVAARRAAMLAATRRPVVRQEPR